jgi:hypothetical protein
MPELLPNEDELDFNTDAAIELANYQAQMASSSSSALPYTVDLNAHKEKENPKKKKKM